MLKTIPESRIVPPAQPAFRHKPSSILQELRTHSSCSYEIQTLLASAGIFINGSRPWDLILHNQEFFHRVLRYGSLGLGESYMEGWWDCEALDQLFERLIRHRLDQKMRLYPTVLLSLVLMRLVNPQRPSRAFLIGRHHYDLGRELFECMLDRHMMYSCGYWHRAASLDQAQEDKLDLICRKLNLRAGERLLDIGCGWGGLLKFAARHYGVRGVGITVSQDQADTARRMCEGLPVSIRCQDYRRLQGAFDKIVSVGMFEHVGEKNYRDYMEVARRCLNDSGLFLLHTIGTRVKGYGFDPWINRYIFPDARIPSAPEIAEACRGLLRIEDWHQWSADYDRTLMAWHERFVAGWTEISGRYSGTFFRMWRYYLLSCAASFRAGRNCVWQIVFSRKAPEQGYRPVR